MDTLESLLKRSKMEAILDSTGSAKRNYIKLLSALQPYGIALDEFKAINEYYIESSEIGIDENYNDFMEYSICISPTYMYRVDGSYIYFSLKTTYGLETAYGYVLNTNDELMHNRIKNDELRKQDFVDIAKIIIKQLDQLFPGIKIAEIFVFGFFFNKLFESIEELENCDSVIFESYKSNQCSDS